MEEEATERAGSGGAGGHLKVVIQLQCLKVLKLAQIPELDRGVVGRSGQVVAILGEGNAGDGARVAREVGHIGALLRVGGGQ